MNRTGLSKEINKIDKAYTLSEEEKAEGNFNRVEYLTFYTPVYKDSFMIKEGFEVKLWLSKMLLNHYNLRVLFTYLKISFKLIYYLSIIVLTLLLPNMTLSIFILKFII